MDQSKEIGVIRIPLPEDGGDASRKAIENITQLASEAFDRVYVLDEGFTKTDDEIYSIPVAKHHYQRLPLRILSHIHFQIKLLLYIVQMRNDFSATFWHAGGYSLILPLLATKLLGIDIYLCVLGNPKQGFANREYWNRASIILSPTIELLETISYYTSDRIIVLSEENIGNRTVKKFHNKVFELKFNYESIPTNVPDFDDRDRNVVYLGRICDLKGASVFAGAIQKIEDRSKISINRYYFIGDGNLKADLSYEMADLINKDKVVFTGWMDRSDAMEQLENSWIFVLPSYSEGLPKALQEAMARGTIPVTTPVGSIPDIINSGENGILLKENKSTELARTIENLFSDEQALKDMSYNAQKTIENELSFESALNDFKSLIEE